MVDFVMCVLPALKIILKIKDEMVGFELFLLKHRSIDPSWSTGGVSPAQLTDCQDKLGAAGSR